MVHARYYGGVFVPGHLSLKISYNFFNAVFVIKLSIASKGSLITGIRYLKVV